MNKLSNPRYTLLPLFVLCLAISLTTAAAARPEQNLVIDYGAIDIYVHDAMARSGSPGLAYAIVHNDEIVHMNAFGVAGPGGRAVTTSTPFIIGSIGKTFTALAIRQLINAGLIEPQKTVQTYIPWFHVADQQASAKITVQNLLDHKSGIPSSAGNQLYQLDDRYDLVELVHRASTVKLNSSPGTVFEYSNVNYLVLGLVAETVSGQSYAEYVQQHILTPLGMHHSYLDEQSAQANGLATGYQSWYGLFIPINAPFPRGMQPSGYAISTVQDMGNYLIAYLNKGIYQGMSIVDQSTDIKRVSNRNSGYDIYWNELPLDPNVMEGQSGGTLNFNGDIQIIPESRWGVVVLMNSRWTLDGIIPTVTAASIANGIACRIKSWPALPEAPLSFRQWYLIIDLILLIIVALGAFKLVSISTWSKGLRAQGAMITRRRLFSIGVDILIGLCLLALPILKEYGLDYFLFAIPDIAIIVCGVAFILLFTALMKTTFLIIENRNNKSTG